MISVFDLFKIGLGPSSSHTVGPMKAAAAFAAGLAARGELPRVASVEVTLLGSLAFTGKGHATDKAVMLGLGGLSPETVDPDAAEALVEDMRRTKRLSLAGRRAIAFDPASAIVFDVVTPAPRHPNTLRLVARDAAGAALADETWLSVGGGFIVRDGAEPGGAEAEGSAPHPFRSGAELLARGRESGLSIADLMRANEAALRPAGEAEAHVERVLAAMFACMDRGLARSGPLPGGLAVERRARAIFDRLTRGRAAQRAPGPRDHGFRQRLRHGGQRGERRRRARRHRADQRRRRRHSRRAALLPRPLRGGDAGGALRFPPDRDRDRRPVQAQRLDLGGRGRLPGGGRRRLLHGRGGPLRRARRLERARSRTRPRSPWSIISA